jgi:O-antigen ligase
VIIIGLALLFGILASFGIFTFIQLLFIGMFIFIIFLAFSRADIVYTIIVVLMFIPLSLGLVIKIKITWAAEPIIVLLFGVLVLKQLFMSPKSHTFTIRNNPFTLPILLYVALLIFNYIRFPLPASSVIGASEEIGGIRFYYDKILMILVFYCTSFLVEKDQEYRQRMSRVLLVMTLIVTTLGIIVTFFPALYQVIVFFKEVEVLAPHSILTGVWHRVVDPYIGTVRAYILWITPFGILLVVSKMIKLKEEIYIAVLLFLFLGLILSATRNFFFGIFAGLTAWALLMKKKRLFIVFIVTGLVAYFVPSLPIFQKQMTRLFYFSSDLERLTSFRFELFTKYWTVFKQNVLFGVGVGATEIQGQVPGTPEYFFAENLRFGGHGFFLGTLYTQGIIGLIPFLIIYIMMLRMGLHLFRTKDNEECRIVGLFTVMFVVYSFIPFIVGGTETYNQLFVVLGILVGTRLRFVKDHDEQ